MIFDQHIIHLNCIFPRLKVGLTFGVYYIRIYTKVRPTFSWVKSRFKLKVVKNYDFKLYSNIKQSTPPIFLRVARFWLQVSRSDPWPFVAVYLRLKQGRHQNPRSWQFHQGRMNL